MRTLASLLLATAIVHGGEFVPLFPKDGLPEGWKVQRWDDVKEEAPPGALWRVKDGC